MGVSLYVNGSCKKFYSLLMNNSSAMIDCLRSEKRHDSVWTSRHSRRRRSCLSSLLAADDRRWFDRRVAATASETLLGLSEMETRLATQLTQFRFRLKNGAKVHAIEEAARLEEARVREWEWRLGWETALWDDAKNEYRRRTMMDIEWRHEERRRKREEESAAAWRKCRRIVEEVADAAFHVAQILEAVVEFGDGGEEGEVEGGAGGNGCCGGGGGGSSVKAATDGMALLPTYLLRVFEREIGGGWDPEEEEEEEAKRRRRGEKVEERSAQRREEDRKLRTAKRQYEDYRESLWAPAATAAAAATTEAAGTAAAAVTAAAATTTTEQQQPKTPAANDNGCRIIYFHLFPFCFLFSCGHATL